MRPTRGGHALAELLVATTLLVVGLLALAGAASQLLRADVAGRVTTAAAAVLADRIERAAAAPCRDTAGTQATRDVTETWSARAAAGVARVADTARYAAPSLGTRAAAVDAAVRCGP